MKQIHEAVQPLRERHSILAAILDFFEEAEKHKKQITGQTPQGQ